MQKESKTRLLKPPAYSFFLFGPRGVGKSTWLKNTLKPKVYIDLLKPQLQLELNQHPENLEARIGKLPSREWVCIDEIQKIPGLLDEVHRLMEEYGWRFALSGSSARKLKRGSANLLAGRAIHRLMEPLCFDELKDEFHLENSLEWGTLPLVIQNPTERADILASYVHTYLREEIKEESLVRKVDPFIRFLEIAGLVNGQQVNGHGIARDAKVPRKTVDVYFSILEDTLMGHWLPAYRPHAKVREQTHPKFYWFDPGVARGAAGLLFQSVDTSWLGVALETLFFHEIRTYAEVTEKRRPISFYRTGSGSEIDFIIETRKRTTSQKAHIICIELKYSKKWNRKWEKAIRDLASSKKVVVEKMFGLYLGKEKLTYDEFEVLPVTEFLRLLYDGKIF